MTPEQLFSILNLAAFLAWVIMAALPRAPWVTTATQLAVPVVFATIYTVLIATTWWNSPGGFSTLAAVSALFSNPWLLLAGWTHYLAFDLLVGAWELRDSQSRDIPHLIIVPCLALTFLFGPAGWLSYIAVRSFRSRS
jgi:hypothetical protein